MPRDLHAAPPVIYEIFPRTFLDTTGSGRGDLRGVTERLDYIADLGVDAIWLAPFYPSPLVDGGYDISDHRAVDPALGTLADFDAIVAGAEARGLGVLVDLVFNHSSSEDPRFPAALAGDDDAAAQYVFRDPRPDGSPPNNWMSFFGGPAWTWSPEREQYYLHQYTPDQPSFDLRNETVQEDMAKTVAFWRDRGVSGFRLDAVTAYLFDPSMKDNPPATPEVRERIEGPSNSPYTYQDHVHDMLPGDGAAFAETVRGWAGEDMWLVGECNTGNKALEMVREFTRPGRLDALYTTNLVKCATCPDPYPAIFDAFGAEDWPLPWWFSSHDHARPASNDPDTPPAQMARFLATILCAMPGPLMLYQGEELGLPNPHLEKNEITDPFELRFWPDGFGRPGARVPLPWTREGPEFGFTSGRPPLPMRWRPDQSVAAQQDEPDSVLKFYREMLALRRRAGFATSRDHDLTLDDQFMTFDCTAGGGRYRLSANFGDAREAPARGETLLRSHGTGDRLPRISARIERL